MVLFVTGAIAASEIRNGVGPIRSTQYATLTQVKRINKPESPGVIHPFKETDSICQTVFDANKGASLREIELN
jgi:hypothetical protein